MQAKANELSTIATAHESTKKERDDAIRQLTEMRTKQETLERMVTGGKQSLEVDIFSGQVPEMAIQNEDGEFEVNPAYVQYQAKLGTTMKQMAEEVAYLRKVAGVTGVQNVNHGNAIAKSAYMSANNIDAAELDEIIKLGMKTGDIKSYKVGDKQEPVINSIEDIEMAAARKLVNDLQKASKGKDMKEIQALINKNFMPSITPTSPRLGGGGDVDKTDAESKFQQYAAQKIDLTAFTEPEMDELIRKGYMSKETKTYRWGPAQKKT